MFVKENPDTEKKKKKNKDSKINLIRKHQSNNMVVKETKIYQNLNNKRWLSIEQNIIKLEKTLYDNYKKLFLFRKSDFLLDMG